MKSWKGGGSGHGGVVSFFCFSFLPYLLDFFAGGVSRDGVTDLLPATIDELEADLRLFPAGVATAEASPSPPME